MADDLNLVEPGQLITAELLNKLITRVQSIAPPDGKVDVPSVFGRTLSDAIQLLKTPGANVQLGSVLDVTGAAIAPNDPTKAGLRVLGQSPSAATRVTPGSGINLVIAGTGTGTLPSTAPRIDGFSPASQAVGEILHIIGQNFDGNRLNNHVTINGKDTEPPGTNSTTNALFVLVPPGAEGPDVPVRVTLPDGRSATGTTSITPSTGAVLPEITAINGVTSGSVPVLLPNTTIVITGRNFGGAAAEPKVLLGTPGSAGVPALTPVAATNDSLTVVIPANIPDFFKNSLPVISVRGNVFGPASPVALIIVF
jgi:hypothetical protein